MLWPGRPAIWIPLFLSIPVAMMFEIKNISGLARPGHVGPAISCSQRDVKGITGHIHHGDVIDRDILPGCLHPPLSSPVFCSRGTRDWPP